MTKSWAREVRGELAKRMSAVLPDVGTLPLIQLTGLLQLPLPALPLVQGRAT